MKAIRRKQVNGWAAALLLPILLRVLVPVGFMPVVGPDFSLQLVVCAGDGPMLASHALPMSASMDMDMSAGMPMDEPASSGGLDAHLHHDDRGACPYGSAPALGALPSFAIQVPRFVQLNLESPLAMAQVVYVEASPRAQSPRAPPV